mgnify:CR=1 FL=1
MQANDVTLKFLNDQLRPQVDFVGTYGLVGVGGTQLLFEPGTTGVNRTPIGSLPGGYGDALSTLSARLSASMASDVMCCGVCVPAFSRTRSSLMF